MAGLDEGLHAGPAEAGGGGEGDVEAATGLGLGDDGIHRTGGVGRGRAVVRGIGDGEDLVVRLLEAIRFDVAGSGRGGGQLRTALDLRVRCRRVLARATVRSASARLAKLPGSCHKAPMSFLSSRPSPALEDPEEPPLDPAVERVHQKLRGLLRVSTLVMAAGLIAVFAAILYRVTRDGDSGRPLGDVTVPAPTGASIASASADGDRLTLVVDEPGGGRMAVVVDLASGEVIARVRLIAGGASAPAGN